MAINKSHSGEDVDKKCIFCLIANDQDEEAEILKKDNELVCFKDIEPAAPHHYLVVPRKHITSCLSLHRGHTGLVERMAEMRKAVLRDQGITDMKDIQLGFHQPPYISVEHLHLHVLAPTTKIIWDQRNMFKPAFVTEECLRKHLKDKAPPLKYCLTDCFSCLRATSSQGGLSEKQTTSQRRI